MHFRATHSDRSVVAETTVIKNLSPSKDSSVFLIRTAEGSRFKIERTALYGAPEEILRYTDLDTRHAIQITHRYPVPGGTRETVLEQLRALDLAKVDTAILVQGRGDVISTRASELSSERGPAVKAALRSLLDGEFIMKLHQLRPVLTYPAFLNSCVTLDPVLGPGCSPDTGLRFGSVEPDCAFDAQLGEPCHKSQIDRINAARASNESVRAY